MRHGAGAGQRRVTLIERRDTRLGAGACSWVPRWGPEQFSKRFYPNHNFPPLHPRSLRFIREGSGSEKPPDLGAKPHTSNSSGQGRIRSLGTIPDLLGASYLLLSVQRIAAVPWAGHGPVLKAIHQRRTCSRDGTASALDAGAYGQARLMK